MAWKNGNPLLYSVWRDMLHRCYNPKAKFFKNYGGRGIKVCSQWKNDFWQFQADMLPTYRKGLTIDRRDNDGHYSPENCWWATRKEQARNTRVVRKVIIEGKEYLAVNLAAKIGIKTDSIVERAEAGLTYKQVMSRKRRYNLDGFKLGASISAARRNAKTHCKNGHEYTQKSTRWTTNGKYTWRDCRICHMEKMRRRQGYYLNNP